MLSRLLWNQSCVPDVLFDFIKAGVPSDLQGVQFLHHGSVLLSVFRQSVTSFKIEQVCRDIKTPEADATATAAATAASVATTIATTAVKQLAAEPVVEPESVPGVVPGE